MPYRYALIVIALVLLTSRAAKADGYDHTICCDVGNNGLCTVVAGATGTFPSPCAPVSSDGTGIWIFALPVSGTSVTPNATWQLAGEPASGFTGLCFAPFVDSLQMPSWCVDVAPLGPLYSNGSAILETLTSNPALVDSCPGCFPSGEIDYIQAVESCRPHLSDGSCPATFSPIGRSCCQASSSYFLSGLSDRPVAWASGTLPTVSALPTPHLARNPPTSPRVGDSTSYWLTNGEPNQPIAWFSRRNGAVVSNGAAVDTTGPAGSTLMRSFPPWTAGQVGSWSVFAKVDGMQTNTLTFSVAPAPVPSPAMPGGFVAVLGLSLAGLGFAVTRRRRTAP